MVDLTLVSGFFKFVIGFDWKWRFWCIPTLRFCDQHPCRGLLFVCYVTWGKTFVFNDFAMNFHKNDPNLISTRGTINKTCILDTITFWWVPAWNGRPKVVPWPSLFEKVVPKRQINHHYVWVWKCSRISPGMCSPPRNCSNNVGRLGNRTAC